MRVERISRRKTLLIGRELFGHIGGECAQGNPRHHADEDPGCQRDLLQRSPHFNLARSTSKNIIRGGRIRCSA